MRMDQPARQASVLEPQAERMGDKSPACPTCGTTGRFAFGLADRGVFVCRNPRCTLEFAFPQPSDEQLNAFYAQYYYGDGQPVLENSPEPYLRQLVTHLQHEVGPLAGKCALDF